MAGLPNADYETDREQIAALITNRDPELSPAPTAFAGEQAGALAQFSQAIGGDVDRAGKDAVPSAQSSDQGLDNWAVTEGISNGTGPGGYGRRGATYAEGFTADLLGDIGTVYPAGQQATAAGITLVLRNSETIPGTPPGTGQVTGTWDADTTDPNSIGTAGNLTPGTVLALISPPGTSESEITLQTGPTVLGRDEESNSSLITRILNKMQRPPNGGNGTDYRDWAQDALDSAGNPVSTAQLIAYVYPNYDGVGSPLVVVLQTGSGTERKISAALIAAIEQYINGSVNIEGQRPFSHDCVVKTGFMPASRALVCRVRCVASKPAYRFDWVRELNPYAVASITTSTLPSWATSAGANVVLELDVFAPQSLKDAVDANTRPRIQVDTTGTGSPVVPDQWQVVAYEDGLSTTSLALIVPSVSNFGTWVQIGNDVYSGGPIVTPVAASILATIDAVGPSRASGLADPAQLWQDSVGVTTLSTAAETTTDSDGITRLVARCIANGVLIGIGPTSTPAVQDVTATDNTINGPEVLYAGRILVTD
ncbi:MAG: hypothetical protein E6Q97_36290 [Desulfurellales bacterium]|nr:MAG: hypothetical protein E6Q97_36290 [Desulfurellales bacterium]